MINSKKKKISIFILLILITTLLIGLLLFLNEQNHRKEILESVIKKEFSISPSTYETNSSFNKFGYMYTLVFDDESKIEYEFFVKKNDENKYVVTYYGNNAQGNVPLKEDEFLTLND
ncbi:MULTISPECIES: hypothetical protein [unclassified Exiguobacterium]|uniref:hypothetical protein n=1 Tax=unclassified Exiguobacterium TaxID=2644629 RepID=UPI001AE1D0A0|nr:MULTISPECIES: hypothetical protein [unclassified Exiguobacterium]